MAAIDTSLLPSGNVRFQMAAMPEPTDPLVEEQKRLANQVTAQNLSTAKYNAQRAKLTDAMRDVMTHDTPEDAIASIDRHVADGTLTAEQAADAKSKVPTRNADGSLPQGAMAAWRKLNYEHYVATNEQLYAQQLENEKQQRISDIMGMGAAPAPAAPTNALAPAPVNQEQALFNQLNPQPTAPAATTPTTNALVPQAQDDNALRRKIIALYAENTPAATAAAKYFEGQLKPTAFEEAKLGTYQPGDYTTASWAKFVKTKDPADLVAKKTAAEIAATTEKPLTPAQQQKLKAAKAEDLDKYNSITQTATDLANLRDQLIGNPATGKAEHPGLGAITGWAGLLPLDKIPKSDASAASTILETIKGKVNALGRQIASVHGKLGNMAVQEWKILADSVQKIDPKAKNFADQINNIVTTAEDLQRNSRGRFQYEYDEDVPNITPPAAGGGAQTPAARTVVRTGTANGKKVVQYSDGSVEYAP